MNTNSEYIAKMDAQLKKWDADVEELRAQGKQINADARAAYFGRIKELRASRDAAQKTFQAVRCASEVAGAQLQAGMEGSWDTMKKALERVSADLRK
jgi:hypothetical protein